MSDPAPAEPSPPPPPEVRRVKLSQVEVDALERMNAAIRSAAASIILSRDEDANARWMPERDEAGRIVAFALENGA